MYVQEAIVTLDYLIPSLCIVAITDMIENGTMQEILDKLMELEEEKIMAGFHQEVHKAKDKSWNERYIKKNKFNE